VISKACVFSKCPPIYSCTYSDLGTWAKVYSSLKIRSSTKLR
jgi:hypothetical protein